MVKFNTPVALNESGTKISYHTQSMMIGSCFSENIGRNLQECCMPITVNPFGILYNPSSIANCLKHIITQKKFTDQDLFEREGLFHSFSHHSSFSNSNPKTVLDQINKHSLEAYNRLKQASHLFITFGTAWVFENKKSGAIVSNCHKVPASEFVQYRLTVSQIKEEWIALIDQLKALNPNLHLVFTVSPIRHLKDGAHENQLSKSSLLLAIDELIKHFGNELISYFPAYELQLDELRDYRFYANDMLHPSELALEYFREKFSAVFLEKDSQQVKEAIEKLLQAAKHRPFNASEKVYRDFITLQLEKINQLKIQYPHLELGSVEKLFQEKIGI